MKGKLMTISMIVLFAYITAMASGELCHSVFTTVDIKSVLNEKLKSELQKLFEEYTSIKYTDTDSIQKSIYMSAIFRLLQQFAPEVRNDILSEIRKGLKTNPRKLNIQVLKPKTEKILYPESSYFDLNYYDNGFLLIPEKDLFIATRKDNELVFFVASKNKEIKSLKIDSPLRNLYFDQKLNSIFATNEFNLLVKIDLETYKVKNYNLVGHKFNKLNFFMSPDSIYLFSQVQTERGSGIINEFQFFTINSLHQESYKINQIQNLTSYGIIGNDQYFFQLNQKNELVITEIQNPTHTSTISDVKAFATNNQYLLLSDQSGNLRLGRLGNSQFVNLAQSHPNLEMNKIIPMNNENHFAFITNQHVFIYDILTQKNIHTVQIANIVRAEKVKNSNYLAVSTNNSVTFIDSVTGKTQMYPTLSWLHQLIYLKDENIIVDYSHFSNWFVAFPLSHDQAIKITPKNINPMFTFFQPTTARIYSIAIAPGLKALTDQQKSVEFIDLFKEIDLH